MAAANSKLPPNVGRPNSAAGATGAGQGASFIDPQAVMRIKNLQMRARVVVEGFYAGIHRSPYHGFSVEFSEYRAYTPGDDLRYLDWHLYARSDRYCIKRFEDETNLLCYLLVDMSRSMSYGSAGYSKSDYARTLAASLAYFLYLQRDAIGVLTFDEQISEILPPRYRPGHLRRMMAALQRDPAGRSTNLAKPLEQVAQTVRKRGLVVLISDLLAPIEDLRGKLGYLRSRGHEVLVLRVLDPAEVDFTFTAPGMFHDVESGRTIYVDPATAKADYQERFTAHANELREVCVSLGIDLTQLTTSRPLELALFDLLQARFAVAGNRRGVAAISRDGGRPDELPHAAVCAGPVGRVATDLVPLDSPHAAGRVRVQLADVSDPFAAAADAPQPVGQHSAALAARLGGRAIGPGVCSALPARERAAGPNQRRAAARGDRR